MKVVSIADFLPLRSSDSQNVCGRVKGNNTRRISRTDNGETTSRRRSLKNPFSLTLGNSRAKTTEKVVVFTQVSNDHHVREKLGMENELPKGFPSRKKSDPLFFANRQLANELKMRMIDSFYLKIGRKKK